MDRYQRKQEEKKLTRMEMINELESQGIVVSRKANTTRVTKKYLLFKEEQRKKKEKIANPFKPSWKLSKYKRQQVEKKKKQAIASIGKNVVPRYRAIKN